MKIPFRTNGEEGGMTFGESGRANSEEAISDEAVAAEPGGASSRLREGVPRLREGPGDRVDAAQKQQQQQHIQWIYDGEKIPHHDFIEDYLDYIYKF